MIVVVPTLNRQEMLERALDYLVPVTKRSDIFVLDNGSSPPLEISAEHSVSGVRVRRLEHNVGNYQTFEVGLRLAQEFGAPIVGFLHSDLFVYEDCWDIKVQDAFDADPLLGLVGFASSNEIDSNGGRGLGTRTNYMGRQECGGTAEQHGRRDGGFRASAMVDGCSMIFRRSVLERIGFRDGFPPHHFYDKLMSCQVMEAGYRVGYMGIQVDHLGGRTVMFEQPYHDLCRKWCEEHGVSEDLKNPGNWDWAVYREAERQFLAEYRDQKRMIPLRVKLNWEMEKR